MHKIDVISLDTIKFEKAEAEIKYKYIVGVDTIIEVSNKQAKAKLTIIDDYIHVELSCDSLEKIVKSQQSEIFMLYEHQHSEELLKKTQKWHSTFVPGIILSLSILIIYILIKIRL